MSAVFFNRYNPGAEDKYVMVDRIVHWERIDYNGVYGTKLFLDTGKELHVGEWPEDVAKKIASAKATKEQT